MEHREIAVRCSALLATFLFPITVTVEMFFKFLCDMIYVS
jgi:hypothetical protein